MEDLFASLTEALAAWVQAVTGTPVKPGDFRLPRDQGQLSLGVFARDGGEEAARRLTDALDRCPQVREVREKNGWLLFWLSGSWFDGLIEWAEALDTRSTGTYVENRMALLARKGKAPCPDEEDVRRALWASYLAHRRGSWRERHGADRVGKPLRRRRGCHIETERNDVKNVFFTSVVCAFAADRRGNFAGKTGKTTEEE